VGLAVVLATPVSLADDWTANFYMGGKTCSQNFYELNASGVPLSLHTSFDTKKRYQAANMTCGYWSVEAGAIRLMCPNGGFPGDRSYSWIENTAPREDGVGTITVVAARLGFAAGKVEVSADGKYNNWKEVGVFTPGAIRNHYSFDWSAPGYKFVFKINDPKMKFFRISPQHPPRNSCDRYLTITELSVSAPAAQENQCTSKEPQEDYFVYVADTHNHRIQVFDSEGNFLRKWGSKGGGIGQFFYPRGIAIGSDGNVYVADTHHHRIQVFDSEGNFVRGLGSRRSAATARNGLFFLPHAVAVDSKTNVYVADTGKAQVQVFDSSGKFLRKWGSYGTGDGQFNSVYGVAVDGSGNVYVADMRNHRVQVFDSSGNFLNKWGSKGAGNGQFYFPESISVDASGSVYVAETGNKRVQVFDSSGNFLKKIGSPGTGDGQFRHPQRIAIGTGGNVYVTGTANHRIQVFNGAGEFFSKWGSLGTGDGQFNNPYGIAIGAGGSTPKPSFITPNCEASVVGSGAPVAVDARGRVGGTTVYLTQYNARAWTGDLESFGINDDGNPGDRVWSAATQLNSGLPAANSRVLLTWGKSVGGKDPKTDSAGVAFRWDNLWPSQQSDLRIETDDSCGTVERARARLDYLRGDKNNEGNKGYQFRKRESLLGAIVHSRAIYVGNPILAWPGVKYAKFKTTHLDREPIIYAGANDGALHGFRAKDGKEVIGYFPASVFDTASNAGLHYFTDPAYRHSYLVDGTPVVSDTFINNKATGRRSWRTVLVGTLRGGGRGLFALDVTNPASFTEANAKSVVMWEFNNTHDAHLGYTFSEPTITLMNNGRWAAITGNGYEDTADGDSGGQAQLFIIYLDGAINGEWTEGRDYLRISTGSGSSANRNGLATPAVVDLNGDGTADRAYAGDLEGNLWAFDLSDRAPVNWAVAYGTKAQPEPVFMARSEDGTAQPITVEPVVTRQKAAPGEPSPNLMVYFGTGKNTLESDKTNTASQSFYGVWDRRQGNLARNALARQKILFESVRTGGKGRVTDPNLNVDYQWKDDTHYGWYLDLPATGERVVSDPKVRGDTVFFNTTIPDAASCGFGGKGWMMSVATHNGGSPEKNNPVFDFDEDGAITRVGDTVVFRDRRYAYAGKAFEDGGAPAGPSLAATMNRHMRYTVGDKTSEIDAAVLNEMQGLTGRIAWQQAYPEIAQTKHDAADTPEKREEHRNK
jgi:hypothetical protein